MDWRRDCRHFIGDRPCRPHKRLGVTCDACDRFEATGERVLIVKLAATGDVLRTTSILSGLRESLGPIHVTWVTAPAAVPLLLHNPAVDRIVPFGGAVPLEVAAESYDRVVNLDVSPDSCALASLARATRRIGFGLGPDQKPIPLHESARGWFEMGLDDRVKRANRRTYQELMFEILGIEPSDPRMILCLTDLERDAADRFVRDRGVSSTDELVGVNTGAGDRWPLKKWTEDRLAALIAGIVERRGARVLLLGGPDERERNRRLVASLGDRVIDGGTENPLRTFCALVGRCDAVLTGDTLAMQIAVALGKPTTVLFGPTSAPEIDLYDRGEKITSDEMDCLGCYLTACDKDPNCMNTIPVGRVHDALLRCLDLARHDTR